MDRPELPQRLSARAGGALSLSRQGESVGSLSAQGARDRPVEPHGGPDETVESAGRQSESLVAREWRHIRDGELRRVLPLTAAALLLVALVLPMWRIVLTAPQYPDGLYVDLYAYPRLGGDYGEVQLLNSYVGFHYPDPVFVDPNYEVHENAIAAPEWILGPVAFVAIAATGVFVALAPTVRKLKLGLTCQLIGTLGVFGGMGILIQYRLHQAGHTLDPNAPLRGVEGFTPPLVGSYEIANISGYAWIGPGGYLTAVAIALLVVAFLLRDSQATVRDVPDLYRTGVKTGRNRFGRWWRERFDDSRSGVAGRLRSDRAGQIQSNGTDHLHRKPADHRRMPQTDRVQRESTNRHSSTGRTDDGAVRDSP